MSGKICAMFGCSNYGMVNLSRSFHSFPRDKELCKKWIIISKRGDLNDILKRDGALKPNSYFMCSDHFKTEDYVNPANKSQGLKRNTVPSVIVPRLENTEAAQTSREKQTFKKGIKCVDISKLKAVKCVDTSSLADTNQSSATCVEESNSTQIIEKQANCIHEMKRKLRNCQKYNSQKKQTISKLREENKLLKAKLRSTKRKCDVKKASKQN